MSTAKYSNLAHIPWAVGTQLLAVLAFRLFGIFHPATFWICGILAWASMFTRDEAKEEYTFINERFGGLRANMPDLYAMQVWKWGKHNLLETGAAGAAVIVLAALAQIAFAVGLLKVVLP